jgi:hypothetical protein
MAAERTEEFEDEHSKSLRELGMEAFWFFAHTALAVLALMLMLLAGIFLKPAPDATGPKLIGTFVAFVFPMAVGFLIAKRQQNDIARYVWISGIIIFAVVCVWVLDLPTGNGLCEHCGAVDKLWRTFFDITNGSGLMGGDGLMMGTWLPLSLFGYAIGASAGLDKVGQEPL